MNLPISFVACPNLKRLGQSNDGGYVICGCLPSEVDELISMGVNDDWSFEKHLYRYFGLQAVYAYDHSVSFIHFLEKSAVSIPKYFLHRMGFREFIRSFTLPLRYQLFFRKSCTHFKLKVTNKGGSTNDTTIDEIFAKTSSCRIFVKIDIEGSEYKIIADLLKYARRIEGLVVEFHETIFLRSFFIDALNQISLEFDLVHAHGNNFEGLDLESSLPEVLEMSFVPKRRHFVTEKFAYFPLPLLDQANNPRVKDLEFQLSFKE